MYNHCKMKFFQSWTSKKRSIAQTAYAHEYNRRLPDNCRYKSMNRILFTCSNVFSFNATEDHLLDE